MSKTSELQRLLTKLERIEKQLQKVRGCSPLTHGWQTQKLAKADRSWDMLAQEKNNIRERLNELGYEI